MFHHNRHALPHGAVGTPETPPTLVPVAQALDAMDGNHLLLLPMRDSAGEVYDFRINFGYSFQKPKAPTLTTTAGASGTAAPGAPVAGAIGAARNAQAAAGEQGAE